MQDQPSEQSLQPPDSPSKAAPSEAAPSEAAQLKTLSDEPLHWILLGVSAAVITAASVLEVHGEESVVIPIVRIPLPGTCTFKSVVGYDCPGCGLTRCFISLAHGDVRRAWSFNAVGIFFFAVVAGQIPFRLFQIWRLRHGLEQVNFRWWGNYVLVGIAVALLLQWLGRWLLGALS